MNSRSPAVIRTPCAVRGVEAQVVLPGQGAGRRVDREDAAGLVLAERTQAVAASRAVVRDGRDTVRHVVEVRARAVAVVRQVGAAVLAGHRQDREVEVRFPQAALTVHRTRLTAGVVTGRVLHERLVDIEVVRLGVDQVAVGVRLVAVVVGNAAPRVARDVVGAELFPDDALVFAGPEVIDPRAMRRERLRRRVVLACVHRPRLEIDRTGQRLAVGAVQDEGHVRLAAVVDRLACLPADLHVSQHRRVDVVHVEGVVADRLVVPLVGTGRMSSATIELPNRLSPGRV